MQSISGLEIIGWSGTLHTVFHHTNASNSPAAPMNQKQLCQPYFSVSHPKSPPNANREKYCEALKMADARPRSAVGNHAATIRPLPGNTGDCASPESSRSPNITLKAQAAGAYPANPIAIAQMDQTTMLIPYTRFDPKRSNSPPDGNCPATYAQPKPENSSPIFAGLNANTFCIWTPPTDSAIRSP